MNVFLPISLDRWRNPIATLLRACVEQNPEIRFDSFSSPYSDEDHVNAREFWQLPNVRAIRLSAMASARYDLIHTASISSRNLVCAIVAKARSGGHARFLNTINIEVSRGMGKDWNDVLRYQLGLD